MCVWDFYTNVPTLGCRGGFGFHTGRISYGCVTVLDAACMRKLVGTLARPSGSYATRCRYECKSCDMPLFGGAARCMFGTKQMNNIGWMGLLVSV